MNYTPAKLYKAKTGNDWYVLFYCVAPNGKKKPFKERGQMNRIKDKNGRKRYGDELATQINQRLKAGWSPFQPKDEVKEKAEKDKLDFYWWFDEKIKHEEARGDAGFYNWKNVCQAKKRLIEFAPTLLVSDLNYKLLKDFEAHLLKRGNSLNNIQFVMSKIAAVTKILVNTGDILYHKNPFISYKPKTTQVQAKRITFEQVKKLRDINLSNPYEDLARDMYIFSFYQAGMRFGDICRVKKDWFTKKHTSYTMNKSKNERKIKIVSEVVAIIEKYKNSPGEYLFPTKVDWSEASKSIDSRNSYYNPKLKRACKAAKIPEISFHTSRHSIADLSKSKNLGIHTIKELLGHSKISTTERYMKKFYEEETDSAIDTLFNE